MEVELIIMFSGIEQGRKEIYGRTSCRVAVGRRPKSTQHVPSLASFHQDEQSQEHGSTATID